MGVGVLLSRQLKGEGFARAASTMVCPCACEASEAIGERTTGGSVQEEAKSLCREIMSRNHVELAVAFDADHRRLQHHPSAVV
jgi:hypothetical protein